MPAVELTNEQVIELVKQLPPADKLDALYALAADADERRDERMAYAEAQMRRLAVARGMDWDALDDEAREDFVDAILHEE